MKRISISFFLIIGLLMMPAAVNASVPERTSHVEDSAHIFPENRLQEIKDSAVPSESSDINFYIRTIETLNEKKSADYAAEVFLEWGLEGNDVLILIAKKEKRIEINYKDTTLLSNVNLPPDYDQDGNDQETPLEEILGKHFMPYAKKGDYASGVVDFINTFRQLNITTTQGAESSESGSSPLLQPVKPPEIESIYSSVFNSFKVAFLPVFILATLPLLIRAIRIISEFISDSSPRSNNANQRVGSSVTRTEATPPRPVSVADALENMINSPSNEDASPVADNDNAEEVIIEPGHRVIRSEENVKLQKDSNKRGPSRVIR